MNAPDSLMRGMDAQGSGTGCNGLKRGPCAALCCLRCISCLPRVYFSSTQGYALGSTAQIVGLSGVVSNRWPELFISLAFVFGQLRNFHLTGHPLAEGNTWAKRSGVAKVGAKLRVEAANWKAAN